MAGNPKIRCVQCGREVVNNCIARHVKSHDPVYREELRIRKNERQRSYAQTEAGRETVRRRNRSLRGVAGARRRTRAWKQSEAGRAAVRAHDAVRRAIKRGEIVRLPCQVCGAPETAAHHHRGYERQYQLDVEWLCLAHHMEAHGRVAA